MAEKIQIKAVEMVRRIRDEQARTLSGKSNEEIIAFFKKAGEATRRKAMRRSAQQAPQERAAEQAPKNDPVAVFKAEAEKNHRSIEQHVLVILGQHIAPVTSRFPDPIKGKRPITQEDISDAVKEGAGIDSWAGRDAGATNARRSRGWVCRQRSRG